MTEHTRTLTNRQLYNLLPSLSNLIVKDAPMSVTIKLRKTLQSVRSVITLLDEARQDKLVVHTSTDKEGKPVTDEEAFAADMEIMLDEKSDVEIHQVRTDEFPSDFPISTLDLDVLTENFILVD